jgi:hypothetical protein
MIKLALCQKQCCPTVEAANDRLIIKDDFGGHVTLTRDQLKILVELYPELEKEMNKC